MRKITLLIASVAAILVGFSVVHATETTAANAIARYYPVASAPSGTGQCNTVLSGVLYSVTTGGAPLLYTVDSAGACINLTPTNTGGGFQMGNTVAVASPAAASTFYVGAGGTLQTSVNKLQAPPWVAFNACTIKKAALGIHVEGTKDTTANTFTITVYDLTSSTNFTDTAAVVAANAVTSGFAVATANDSVAAGDKLVLQVLTASSYGTQPTNVVWMGNVLCQ